MSGSPTEAFLEELLPRVRQLVADERVLARSMGQSAGEGRALEFLRRKGHHAAADDWEREMEIPF